MSDQGKTLTSSEQATPPRISSKARPEVRGKFLFLGDQKLYLRGVTYGTFRPAANGHQFPEQDVVRSDFAAMAANGINAVRTYTMPPGWLLDEAAARGIYVMAGVPWEQHITFLDDESRCRQIRDRVRTAVRECAGHPAILCYTIGNEIPASIVRWHGRRPVEAFIESLYDCAKAEDPGGLVTYVNFPSTEYLELDFLDFASFNVYLETEDRLSAYLSRLQTLSGEKPLVMAEVGLDSRRNSEFRQAEVLDWQIRTVFSAGCAGVFLFAWTDEWYRGGFDIEDWDFGLVRRDRRPKPALTAVRYAFANVPFHCDVKWPSVSVVVCSYNGSRTLRETLQHLTQLRYPSYEVIVVNDGSTDSTALIAAEFNVRVISISNGGLSNARNVGMQAATGEIVAYCDDDAYPDPHWLHYLAHTYITTDYAGVGGPNLPPPGDGSVADAVANAPGGPVHVLLSDTEAEHIPGCNSSYRRSCLVAVGGYDPTFRVAGDDVDVCWRIQKAGWKVGFHPAALVWHHRRNSIGAYWRQQRGYGKAEALLERKWPEKYNVLGHLTWKGHIYSAGALPQAGRRWRVYYGTWGSALFQSLYQSAPGAARVLVSMPEWYLVCAGLAFVSALGFAWQPLLAAIPLFVLALALPVAQVCARASVVRLKPRGLTILLFMVQPLARLRGRISWGLAPWRIAGASRFAAPRQRTAKIWSEQWHPAEYWLADLERELRQRAAGVTRGGDFDRWDLQVATSAAGGIRIAMAVEEHGGGKQMIRFRLWPVVAPAAFASSLILAILGFWASSSGSTIAACGLDGFAALILLWMALSCGYALGGAMEALVEMRRRT